MVNGQKINGIKMMHKYTTGRYTNLQYFVVPVVEVCECRAFRIPVQKLPLSPIQYLR